VAWPGKILRSVVQLALSFTPGRLSGQYQRKGYPRICCYSDHHRAARLERATGHPLKDVEEILDAHWFGDAARSQCPGRGKSGGGEGREAEVIEPALRTRIFSREHLFRQWHGVEARRSTERFCSGIVGDALK
jgi:hypothetical protein